MNNLKRYKSKIILPIAISLLVHLILFFSANNVFVSGGTFSQPRKKRIFKIKTLASNIPKRVTVAQYSSAKKNVLKFETPSLDVPQLKSRIVAAPKKLNKNLSKNKKMVFNQSFIPDASYFNEFFGVEKDKKERKLKKQRTTQKSILKVSDLIGSQRPVKPDDIMIEVNPDNEFYEKMPGFTPQLSNVFIDSPTNIVQANIQQPLTGAVRQSQGRNDLKEYFVSNLDVYYDPVDDQKYFKMRIHIGKDSIGFPSHPKEIVFLIDCSISTQADRLDEFKEGIQYSLNHLNKGDLFNILAFKKSIYRFQKNSVLPTKEHIQEALVFVSNLKSGEKTDTYNVLNQSIKEDRRAPSYIFLLSDGRATKGITNSRQIINEISQFNAGKTSIFAFSGGLRVNRYLLDFISYKNRGWAEYSTRTNQISDRLSNMYMKVKDPILLNLKYRVSGLPYEDIFPKMLPDFFRNTEFTLYGRYKEEDEFFLQLIGDSLENSNEFIVRGSLKEATPGDFQIARDWAFNKIYHLIGQLKDKGDNSIILKEIKELSRKFGIKTPYSKSVIK